MSFFNYSASSIFMILTVTNNLKSEAMNVRENFILSLEAEDFCLHFLFLVLIFQLYLVKGTKIILFFSIFSLFILNTRRNASEAL